MNKRTCKFWFLEKSEYFCYLQRTSSSFILDVRCKSSTYHENPSHRATWSPVFLKNLLESFTKNRVSSSKPLQFSPVLKGTVLENLHGFLHPPSWNDDITFQPGMRPKTMEWRHEGGFVVVGWRSVLNCKNCTTILRPVQPKKHPSAVGFRSQAVKGCQRTFAINKGPCWSVFTKQFRCFKIWKKASYNIIKQFFPDGL